MKIWRSIVLFVLLAASFFVVPSQTRAGGYTDVSNTNFPNSEIERWGTVFVDLHNTDSQPLNLAGNNGWSAVIQPDESKSFSFTTSNEISRAGDSSTKIIVTVLAAPTVSNITTTSATLSWGSWQTLPGSNAASGYGIWYYPTTTQTPTKYAYTTNISQIITALAPGTNYTAWIQAFDYNMQAISSYSPYFTFSTSGTAAVSNGQTATTTGAVSTTTAPSTSQGTNSRSTAATSATAATTTTTGAVATTAKKATISVGSVMDKIFESSSTPVVSGRILKLSGKAEPNSTLVITIHSDPISANATSDANGNWLIDVPLGNLTPGDHAITAQYKTGDTLTSEVSLGQFIYAPATTTTSSLSRTRLVVGLVISEIILILLLTYLVWRRKRNNQVS